MEYLSYVWSLGGQHASSKDPLREEQAAPAPEQLVQWLSNPLLEEAAGGEHWQHGVGKVAPEGEVFVMVSRSTLKRLGVWEAVAPLPIGASLPSRTLQHGKTHWSSSVQCDGDIGALGRHFSSHVASTSLQTGCKLVLTDTLHKRSSPNDPLAQAPIVLAMEHGLFYATFRAKHETTSAMAQGSHPLAMDAFKRVTSLLEGVVRQDAEPEVMGADDAPYEMLDAKAFAERMQVTDQTVYNQEKAGRLISVLSPGRERGRRFPGFQLSTRLNRDLHQDAISMYRSRGEDMTLYWDFLRTRHEAFGGSTGVDFLLNRVANPALQDLAPDDLAGLFLETAEEDLHRAVS